MMHRVNSKFSKALAKLANIASQTLLFVPKSLAMNKKVKHLIGEGNNSAWQSNVGQFC